MLTELTDRQWLWCAAGLYAAGFLLGTFTLLRHGRPSGIRMYALIAIGYVVQFAGLAIRGRTVGGCPLGNTFELYQFTAWSATTLYLLVGTVFRSSILGYFTAALSAALTAVSLAVPGWDATRHSGIFGRNGWIELHAALATFSYGVFALLALTSAMFVLRHFSLKSKHLGGLFSFLPSIIDLDHIEVRLLAAGVGLLAISLAVGGAYWARDTNSASWWKIGVTLGIWAAYAVTLFLRMNGRLLARRFAWTCMGLFAAALLSLAVVDGSRHPDSVRIPSHLGN